MRRLRKRALIGVAAFLTGMVAMFSPISVAIPAHAVSYYTCDANSTSTSGSANPYIAFWYKGSSYFWSGGSYYQHNVYTYYYSYVFVSNYNSMGPTITTTTQTVSCNRLLWSPAGGGGSGGW